MTERKELIDRLRWHAKSMCNGDMYREAADMLEADAPAVPQEPVAWYEYNADLDAWFLAYGHNPKAKTRPLVFGDAAPQPRQRLTDAEIIDLAVETNLGRKLKPLGLDTGEVFYTDASYKTGALIDFARKVRGEA